MKYCVLDNDVLDPEVAPLYISYGAMFERLLRGAGAQELLRFSTPRWGSTQRRLMTLMRCC